MLRVLTAAVWSVNKILCEDILSEAKIVGDERLTDEEMVTLLMRCIQEVPNFERSLGRKLPRISAKMHEQSESFKERRRILRDLFGKIDKDGTGHIDNEEMRKFFGLSGGGTR